MGTNICKRATIRLWVRIALPNSNYTFRSSPQTSCFAFQGSGRCASHQTALFLEDTVPVEKDAVLEDTATRADFLSSGL